MYLPQVTSGPSAVTWSPDSTEVVYSMQGSLWRQKIDSAVPVQLTAGPGYDYEPDWSPDGKWIVFSRYDRDAVELQILEVNTGRVSPFTTGGAVNVDARWSPDGKRIAFVSTSYNKHFHIFVAEMENGKAVKSERVTEEHKTENGRYYYRAIDQEISPTWSADSAEIIFLSNRDCMYGTGGFWRMNAQAGSTPRLIHYEETAWRAHPDWSPEGKRVIYSSYLGREWHQLWIMTAEGGDVFPLTYGDFDITEARWARDGKKIAYISNRDGNTSLGLYEMPGGKQTPLAISERKYLRPMGRLTVTVLDQNRKPVAARVMITGPDGRFYGPDDAWFHADDSFDRSERPFEVHYFHTQGQSVITVPPGKITVDAMKGFEYEWVHREVTVKEGESGSVELALKPLAPIPDWGPWISGDLHVHMNYCGTYRSTSETLMRQAAAENLPIVFDLIVNKEQRFPDVELFTGKPDPVSNSNFLLIHSQEYHTNHWGHMGILNTKDHILIPGYSGYRNTAASSVYPTNSVVADEVHAQGGLAGYVHPFDSMPDTTNLLDGDANELPVDLALGKVDYMEVMGFSHHQETAAVWYRLLNCGFHLPTGAGTDAMANYASLRGPVGLNRVYVKSGGPLDPDRWTQKLKEGRSFATNGPLLGFTIDGNEVGDSIKLSAGKELPFKAFLRSFVPVEHLQIVSNGKVIREIALTDPRSADVSGTIPALTSGWYVLRAWSSKATYPILDLYPYATTSPIYVTVADQPIRSREDATYFVAWIEKLIEMAKSDTSYNTPQEKDQTIATLSAARDVFAKQQ